MSFTGDLFGGSSSAAQQQQQAAMLGIAADQQLSNQAQGQVQQAAQQAVAPYNQLFPVAQQGIQAYGNLLGLGGPAGSQSARAQLQTMPGYQFALGQGNNAVNASAAAGGTLGSGNNALALQKYGQGLASQNYNNYVSQLQPYFGLGTTAAGGIADVYNNLGRNEASITEAEMNAINSGIAGYGKAGASGSLGRQALDQSLLTGGINLATSGLGSLGSPGSGTSFVSSLFGGGGGGYGGQAIDNYYSPYSAV